MALFPNAISTALNATGWVWSRKIQKHFRARTTDPHVISDDHRFGVYFIPYSEHSSYNEIIDFLQLVKPTRIIPTVGSDKEMAESQSRILHAYQNRTLLKQQAISKLFGVHEADSLSSSAKSAKMSETVVGKARSVSLGDTPLEPIDIEESQVSTPISVATRSSPEMLAGSFSKRQNEADHISSTEAIPIRIPSQASITTPIKPVEVPSIQQPTPCLALQGSGRSNEPVASPSTKRRRTTDSGLTPKQATLVQLWTRYDDNHDNYPKD